MSRSSLPLFFGLLLVYNLNLRQVSSHDTYASRFVPISILRDGDLILDEFVPETIKQQAGADFFSDYFHYARGHFYDSHPPIGPLLALPVYALPAWIGIPARAELVANLFSKLAASIMAALSALAVFAASKGLLRAMRSSAVAYHHDDRGNPRRLSRRACLRIGDIGLVDGKPRDVDSHAGGAWVRSGALGLDGGPPRPRRNSGGRRRHCQTVDRSGRRAARNVPRTSDVVQAQIGVTCSASVRPRSSQAWPACSTTIGCSGTLWAARRSEPHIWMKELGTTDMFSGSLPVGLAGLTVSPSRGILIFSPVVVIAVVGALKAWRSTDDPGHVGRRFGRRDAVLLGAIREHRCAVRFF